MILRFLLYAEKLQVYSTKQIKIQVGRMSVLAGENGNKAIQGI